MDKDYYVYTTGYDNFTTQLYQKYKTNDCTITSNKISTKPITSSKVKKQVLENSVELGVDIVQKINNTQYGE